MSTDSNAIQTDREEQPTSSSTIICVNCPCGCEMTVVTDVDNRVVSVVGNECARGLAHAQDEAIAPARVLTMSLCVKGALEPLSVKTAAPIPMHLMNDAIAQVRELTAGLTAPIQRGAAVCSDICGTGIPLIATKSI